MKLLILFLASFGATFLSAMSGGGASAISLPIYLSMGVPLPLTILAHKLSSCIWTPIAGHRYLKGKKVDWVFLAIFTVIGLFGVYLGVEIIQLVDTSLLQRGIGVFILILVISMMLKKSSKATKVWPSWLMHLAAFPMGVYESLLGSGNGVIFASIFAKTKKTDLITALGYYYMVAFIWVLLATILLGFSMQIDVKVIYASAAGSILGAALGSKLAIKKGEGFVKIIFIIIGTALGLKLVLGL